MDNGVRSHNELTIPEYRSSEITVLERDITEHRPMELASGKRAVLELHVFEVRGDLAPQPDEILECSVNRWRDGWTPFELRCRGACGENVAQHLLAANGD